MEGRKESLDGASTATGGMLNKVQGIEGLYSVLDDQSGYPDQLKTCHSFLRFSLACLGMISMEVCLSIFQKGSLFIECCAVFDQKCLILLVVIPEMFVHMVINCNS